jgi:hypothetical protein
MYMLRRIFGKDFDNSSRSGSSLASSRITESDMHLDSFPLTLRNSTNRKGKNVLIYPSLPSDDVNGRDSSLARPASATPSDINLDLSSPTLRSNSANKAGKNAVWVHATP